MQPSAGQQPKPKDHGYKANCITWYACLLPSFRWYSLTDHGEIACQVCIGTQQPRAGFEPVTSWPQLQQSSTQPLVHQKPVMHYDCIKLAEFIRCRKEPLLPGNCKQWLTPLASFNCTGMAFRGGYFLLQLLQQLLLHCALRYTMAHWSWLILHLCSWSVLQLWL